MGTYFKSMFLLFKSGDQLKPRIMAVRDLPTGSEKRMIGRSLLVSL
jgi:hypothetical protein